jgi:hypothetical protein
MAAERSQSIHWLGFVIKPDTAHNNGLMRISGIFLQFWVEAVF